MAKLWVKTLNITSNPSGAAAAARQGHVVMIVDVIDMSTTAETALENGVIDIFAASPDNNNTPITVNPEKIGYFAGKKAVKHDTDIIIATEPRLMSEEDKKNMDGINLVEKGIDRAGASVDEIIPNLGKEIRSMTEFKEKIMVIVSPSGGSCFDAAYNYGASEVITGTIARTGSMKGDQPAVKAAKRAIDIAGKHRCGISLVAASSNSMEDVLAADYIGKEILNRGFLKMDNA